MEFLALNRTFQAAMAPLLNDNHKRAADSCLGDAALGRSELNRPTCVCAESADEARHISVCVAQWRAPGFAQEVWVQNPPQILKLRSVRNQERSRLS